MSKTSLEPPPADLARLLLNATRAFEREMIDRLAEAGLDMLRPRHLPVLRALDPEKGSHAAAIARHAGLTRQAIAQVLAEFQQLGIVAQSPDPADARAKIVRYTAFGARGHRRAMAVFSDIEREHAKRLGSRRIAQLKADLELLTQAGERRP